MTRAAATASPGRARTLSWLLALGLGGCSWWLGFDDPPATIDAAGADVIAPPWDAGADLYEPNDAPETAIDLEPGRYEITIAPRGDQDFWRFVIAEPSDVAIEVQFAGDSDLELELYSISEPTAPLAWSRGVGERERILRSAAAGNALSPGVYVIRVYGFNDDQLAHYALTLAVTTSEEPAQGTGAGSRRGLGRPYDDGRRGASSD